MLLTFEYVLCEGVAEVDGSPESTPRVWHGSILGKMCETQAHLTLTGLIYFHINPLPRYLTCKVSNLTPRCPQTDSCVSWHQRSEAGQYCAVCRCDVTPAAWGDGPGQATGPPSRAINHWDDRNSGLTL